MSGLEELKSMSTSSAELKTRQDNIYDQINAQPYRNSDVSDKIPFAGMNTDDQSVNKMKAAIYKYANDVCTIIRKLNEKADAAKAFGPDIAKHVAEYMNSMEQALISIVGNLKAFSDDVQTAAETYKAKGQAVIQDVSTQSTNISDAASSNKWSFDLDGRSN